MGAGNSSTSPGGQGGKAQKIGGLTSSNHFDIMLSISHDIDNRGKKV
jgi:hypothetical protein